MVRYLIGFMGAGKTTLGRQMASELGVPFMDTDKVIEEKWDKSITDIFADEGEVFFREMEKRLILAFNAIYSDPSSIEIIIATGGGLPCYSNNMDLLTAFPNECLYLKKSPEILFERLSNLTERAKRPLLSKFNDAQLLQFITSELEKRSPFYEKGKITY